MAAIDSRLGAALFTPACLAEGRLLDGIACLREEGSDVVHLRRIELTERQVREIWAGQDDEFTAERWAVAVRLFCAGPSVLALVVGGPTGGSAAEWLKELQGPSDPERLEAHHLRARLRACNKVNNLVHVPAEPAALARELAIVLSPADLAAAREAAAAARPLADLGRVAEALAGPGTPGTACAVRNAVRLRWRALRRGEEAAGDAPAWLREQLRADSRWLDATEETGARLLGAWRRERAGGRFGEAVSEWLAPGEPVGPAMVSLDRALEGEPVEAASLERRFAAAGLGAGEWELLSILTEVVSQEARQCA